MSRQLAGLLTVLGAGMKGYGEGVRIKRNEDRQDVRDQRETEDYQFNKTQRDKGVKLEQDLINSQKDIAPGIVADTGATYADHEMLAQDNRENRRNFEASGQPAPAPIAPASYTANGQNFATRAAAEGTLAGVNSQASRDQRAADAYRNNGMVDKARQYDQFARAAIDEGTDKILGAIKATAPSVDAVKKAGGVVGGTVGAEAADIFNKTGSRWKVAPDTVVEHFIAKDPSGREFVNSRVLGPDGKPIVDDVRTANMMLMDVKSRMEVEHQQNQAYQTGLQIAEAGRHNQASEGEQSRSNKATESNAAAQTSIAGARLKMDQATFKKQTLEGQLAEMEKVLGPMTPEEKKTYGKAIVGIRGKGADDATIMKITEKWAENNPTAGPKDIASFKAGITKAFSAIGTNNQIESALSDEFGKHKPGSPGYAAAWDEAKTSLRMTDEQLTGMGFAKPESKAVIAARSGTSSIPSQPPQKVWIGNVYSDNPAYADWTKKYGDQRAAEQIATAKRLDRAPVN